MISIIIPIYNTPERKLLKCIHSIQTQSYDNLEIIIINDCSTKKTLLPFLESLQKKDKRIKLINNSKNQGIEKSRFIGLAIATGNYLMFMDHDDYLENKVLSYMVNNLKETNADVIQGKCYDKIGPFKRKRFNPTPIGIIKQPQLKDKYYCSFFGVNIIPVEVWGKLYKMETIKKASLYPRGLSYTDDSCFNMFLFPYVNSISVIDRYVYTHRYGGYSSCYTGNSLIEYKKLYELKKEAIQNHNYPYAQKYINIEMKNILEFDLNKRITTSKYTKDEIILFLSQELKDSIWDEVCNTIIQDLPNDIFAEYLAKKDADKLYLIVSQKVNSFKYQVKMFITKTIKYLIKYL